MTAEEVRANARQFATALVTAMVVRAQEGVEEPLDLVLRTLSCDVVYEPGWGWEVLLSMSEGLGRLLAAAGSELGIPATELWRIVAEPMTDLKRAS